MVLISQNFDQTMIKSKGSLQLILIEPLFPESFYIFGLLWIMFKHFNEVSDVFEFVGEDNFFWIDVGGVLICPHVSSGSQ